MNISVLNIKSQQIEGKQVCVEAHMLFSLVDSETGLKYRLAEEVKLSEPSDDQFIDYNSVTEQDIIKWVVDILSEQKISGEEEVSRYEQIRSGLESGLAKMIESKKVISGLPWEKVEESNNNDVESAPTPSLSSVDDTTDS